MAGLPVNGDLHWLNGGGYDGLVDEARRVQIEVFRSWTPEERLRRGMELTTLCLEAREARLRLQHPAASEGELRQIRLREVLSMARREEASGPLRAIR